MKLKIAVMLTAYQVNRSDDDSDISIFQRSSPKDKDTIEKERRRPLLARVRTQVSTSLVVPVYPYLECEPEEGC